MPFASVLTTKGATRKSTHVDEFEGTTVLLHWDPEDGMQLTGQHVDSGPRGEAADEWVRQKRRQKPQADQPQEDLEGRKEGKKEGGGGNVSASLKRTPLEVAKNNNNKKPMLF